MGGRACPSAANNLTSHLSNVTEAMKNATIKINGVLAIREDSELLITKWCESGVGARRVVGLCVDCDSWVHRDHQRKYRNQRSRVVDCESLGRRSGGQGSCSYLCGQQPTSDLSVEPESMKKAMENKAQWVRCSTNFQFELFDCRNPLCFIFPRGRGV